MKHTGNQSERTCADGALSFKLMALMALTFSGVALTLQAAPSWWSTRGATTPGATLNDYDVVNQGQLKQFTTRAVDEMNANLPGGAGTVLTNIVYGWQQDYAMNNYATNSASPYNPNDFSAIRKGQLKYIGNKIWAQLVAAGYTNTVPSWLGVNTNVDMQLANIGQLKAIFNFDLSAPQPPINAVVIQEGTVAYLNWNESSYNVQNFIIQEKINGGAWTSIATSVSSSAVAYAVTGLSLGNTYSFQIIAANSIGRQSSPSVAQATPTSGLVLWFKADAGVTFDASTNVASWTDQVYTNIVSEPGTSGPSYVTNDIGGMPALRFNGSQYLTNGTSTVSGLSGATTIITVGMSSNSGQAYAVYLGSNTSPGQNRATGFDNGNELFDTQFEYALSPYFSPSVFRVETETLDSSLTNVCFFQNGSAFETNMTSAASAVSSGITVGNVPGASYTLQGDLAEIMVYNHQLSQSELLQVGLYLSNKYGISFTAPAPLIIPNSGAVSSSTSVSYGTNASPQVTRYTVDGSFPSGASTAYSTNFIASVNAAIDGAVFNGGGLVAFASPQFKVGASSTQVGFFAIPSPATIHYTLDGTTPTNSSLLYTSPFTLNQSCVVTAAIFFNNVCVSTDAQAQFYIGDTGNKGISDAWAMEYFGTTNIIASTVSPGGLTYLQDYLYGYNPTVYSSNGDGLSDLINYQLGYAGTNTDINGYGLSNAQQLALGLDPFDTGVNPSLPSGTTNTPTINLTMPTNAIFY